MYYWIHDGFYLLGWIKQQVGGYVQVSQVEYMFRRLNKLINEIDKTKTEIRELYEVSQVNPDFRGGIVNEKENPNPLQEVK